MKAVIFDMDGVIVDSEELHLKTEKILFEKHSICILDEDWANLKGKTDFDIFTSVLQKHNINNLTPEQLMEEKIKLYPEMAERELKLFKGFHELINYLKPKYKIALATSSLGSLQELTFNKFNLHSYFDAIVTADMVTNGKPHPEPYFLAMKKLNSDPADCIVIEDADNGITAAKSAGAKVIAVTHSLNREKLKEADYIVDNLKEVKEIFEKIN